MVTYPFNLYAFWYAYPGVVKFSAGIVYDTMRHGSVRWYEQPTLGLDGI